MLGFEFYSLKFTRELKIILLSASGKGKYSCLELNVVLQRQLSFYAFDLYVPSALIVLISFMSFIIDHNVVPAR